MAMLKEAQVAPMLGVSIPTLRGWRHRHMGPSYVKLSGRAVRYDSSVIQAWIESQTVETAHPPVKLAKRAE